MKVAILGYGRQGQSAADYWHAKGEDITICDQKTNLTLPSWAKAKLGDNYLKDLGEFDLIIRSPSIYPPDIAKANSPAILNKVTSTTNEFLKVCPTKNIIGVTGTKGKGTTSTLITKILEAADKRVHLGGNIGLDPLLLLKNNIQKDDWVVLEIANFQLIDLKQSPLIAVCLMISREHLDWHESFEDYTAAKQNLFIHQTNKDTAIYYAKNAFSIKIAAVSQGEKIPYMEEPGAIVQDQKIFIEGNLICSTDDIKLLGEHNWQNVCAAVTTAWKVTRDIAAIKKAILNFTSLPHRIEFIRALNGVSYYNDSFATGQGATIAAIKAIKKPKVLILGGYDRGLDLEGLYDVIIEHKNDISSCILIGATANKISKGLSDSGFENFEICPAKTMPEIVKLAAAKACPGEAVLFSPGFASFDMFKDFEDRGNQFREQVLSL